MWIVLRNLALFLLPVPEHGSSESDAVFRWRQSVALAIVVLAGVEVMFILLALGYLSFMGLNGFASVADIQPLVKQGMETRITQIETRITADRTLQCQAIMQGNQAAMNYSYFRLQEDVDAYKSASSYSPRIPGCDELIPSVSIGINAPTPIPTPSTKPSTAPTGAK